MTRYEFSSNDDVNDDSLAGEDKTPMVLIEVFPNGAVSLMGRDDIGMEDLVILLRIVADSLRESLDARRTKAKEN
jgi:hypothetical protein